MSPMPLESTFLLFYNIHLYIKLSYTRWSYVEIRSALQPYFTGSLSAHSTKYGININVMLNAAISEQPMELWDCKDAKQTSLMLKGRVVLK